MYRDNIQLVIDYIEDNLKTEITAMELSDMAGYSLFHFYRIFQSWLGMPVMQYIGRRRLLHAMCEIHDGRKMIDTALDYGFSTYAGFYKAFVHEFGCTPAQFQKTYKVRRPHRINIMEETIMVGKKQVLKLLTRWGLEGAEITDVIYPETGVISDTAKYIGDAYVLKYTDDEAAVIKENEIKKALQSVGLGVAENIPTLDGKTYIKEDGLCYYLTKRIHGERVSAGKLYREEYWKNARFIGEIIGQLSLALEKLDIAVTDKDLLTAVTERSLPAVKDMLDVDKTFWEKFETEFKSLYPRLPRQIIHRDPNPGNIILAEDAWGFIDFELSERNVRIYDPCYAATAILSESFDEGKEEQMDQWIHILQEIFCGYDSVVHTSEAEREAVPYIILANQIICTAFFAGSEKYRELYETNKKMTEWICRNFERLHL